MSEISSDNKNLFKTGGPLCKLIEAAAHTGNEQQVIKALKLNSDAGYTFRDVFRSLIIGYLSGGQLEKVKKLFSDYPQYIQDENFNQFPERLVAPVLRSNCRECFDWVAEKIGENVLKDEAIRLLKYYENIPLFMWDVINEWNDDRFNQKLFDSLLTTDNLEDLITLYKNYKLNFSSPSIRVNRCFIRWIELQQSN